MACCNENNIQCCDVCNCLRYSSPNNSIQIDKTGCDVNLQLTPNTLQNLLDIESSSCITVLKQIINGKLIFTPTINLNCLSTSGFIFTADNGLSKDTPSNVQLGGPLLKDTLIALQGYNLRFLDTSGPNATGIEILPGIANATNWLINTNLLSGKVRVFNNARFDSNVSIGDVPSADQVTGTRLNVNRQIPGSFPSISTLFTTTHELMFGPDVTSGNMANILYSTPSFNRYNFYPTKATISLSSIGESYCSANHSEFVFGAHGSNVTSHGNISASTSRGYFIYNSNIDAFIGHRIMSPVVDVSTGYTGTVATMIGFNIEDQRASMGAGGTNGNITRSYGIKQDGVNDDNLFNATNNIFPNIPKYASDSAAMSDTNLPLGSLYRLDADPQGVRVKLT